MPLGYLGCFVVVIRGIHGNVDIYWYVIDDMPFFTRIKLVACVLACAHAMTCIKWIRLIKACQCRSLGSYAYEIYLNAQMVAINICVHSGQQISASFLHQELCIQLNQATCYANSFTLSSTSLLRWKVLNWNIRKHIHSLTTKNKRNI